MNGERGLIREREARLQGAAPRELHVTFSFLYGERFAFLTAERFLARANQVRSSNYYV